MSSSSSSIPILDACRKRKRKPKLYGFQSFADADCPISSAGTFRDNIRVFLQECAAQEDYSVQGMPIWCTLLVHKSRSLVVPLYTIEENVKYSQRPYCDYCRCTGWSNHFVSKRKYHLVIPTDTLWNKPLDDGVFDIQTHLLHGLIHANGFGHLVCINGIEAGSKYLCGREIMDLWDRICTNLQARKITVEDTSKKRSMDIRLLYGVAYGHPWFGRWGYKFYHGSFGVKDHHYNRALEILSSLKLDKIIEDFVETEQFKEIKKIIRHYRDLSETQLITMRDMLKFMLTIKSSTPTQKKTIVANSLPQFPNSPKHSLTRSSLQNKTSLAAKEKPPLKHRKFSSVMANMDSRWPQRRLEFAAEVIVSALKEKKERNFGRGGGMTRQDVRDAARLHIGDTGLLDYVLKSLNNVVVGNHIVRRAVNPMTRILEFTIHDLNVVGSEPELPAPNPKPRLLPSSPSSSSTGLIPGLDVYNDVVFLYRHVLLGYPESELVDSASQAILDTKHFVKEWPLKDEDEDQRLTFVCRFKESEFKRESPHGEIVVVPLHTTVGELKTAAEVALNDTYCVTESFKVSEIVGLEEVEDAELLFGTLESGVEISVRGSGVDLETQLRYQSGCDTWMVRCECGARDDDGERMVACDICEVWQHTRCCGIGDEETVPPLFVCSACCGSLAPQRSETAGFGFECGGDLLLSTPATGCGVALGY
ncbi:PHD finger protein MALE MEIOCYTE DEATH 1 [Ziziphus jujuba]|uniref:PHD finger protein MALE MEIOCYTE DEATH 1 n=1 Tax=Ziziphus jujuba TaxID=326968 RepID=A0A6P3Z6U3_ZIZJJ|nr:PHD finger protein MALE MEIOCYTE DEATH 1 [Ziziphus jujuba]